MVVLDGGVFLYPRCPQGLTKRCAQAGRCRANVAHTTVKAKFWSWLSSKCLENLSSCSLFARQRLQGYLGYTKTPTPLGLPYGPSHGPTVGC